MRSRIDLCVERRDSFSVSGHPVYGYPVTAHDVRIGNFVMQDFYYYLVLENELDIALLGFDFIDHCKRHGNPGDDIILTEFEYEGYGTPEGAIGSNEVTALINSQSSD